MAHYERVVRVGLLVSVRRCRVCQSSIHHLHPNRVCCGHPRCKRTYERMPRSQKLRARAQAKEAEDAAAARDREVRGRYAYARLKGASEGDALTVVARRMELRITEVIAIVRGPK